MERRKKSPGKPGEIPKDYAKMVVEVFTSNFDSGLKELKKLKKAQPTFSVNGAIYLDEVVLAITLLVGKELSATTVHASVDFDPKASSPTIQDLLAACVDAIGTVFYPLLSGDQPGSIEKIADPSLGALDDVPFEWTAVAVERFRVFVMLDKSNPNLDRLADDWLRKHDPELQALEEQEEKETEGLFVTGVKARRGES